MRKGFIQITGNVMVDLIVAIVIITIVVAVIMNVVGRL